MKILIIEDNKLKLDAIKRFLSQLNFEMDLDVKENYYDGIQALNQLKKYDLLLLDMSMSIHRNTTDEVDPKPNMYAGKDIMSSMGFSGIYIPTIVITMYNDFLSAEKTQTFNELERELFEEYGGFFLGMIKYQSNTNSWKVQLERLLERALKENGNTK